MTQYPVPKPEFFNRLKNNPLLALPDQQATLDQYATGEIGIHTTVARILADAKVRGPILQAERDATTKERARRVRVQREMALNETATGPTFVDCDAEGNPLIGSASSNGDEADESGSSGTDHSNSDQELN